MDRIKRVVQIRIFILFCIITLPILPQVVDLSEPDPKERSHIPPLMERYILDEIKQLRLDMMNLKVELTEKIVNKELNLAKQSLDYNTNTVTYFFYVLAGTASLLALVGWQSLRDIKNNVRLIADKEISRLTEEYEKRLTSLEKQIIEKSKLIIANQQEIEKTQNIHSLWVLASTEIDLNKKIQIYDEILESTPEDADVLYAKAKVIRSLDEHEWSLNVCNKIIETNPGFGKGYYFRACIYADLNHIDNALIDLEVAIEISEIFKEKARTEKSFHSLRENPKFQKLIAINES